MVDGPVEMGLTDPDGAHDQTREEQLRELQEELSDLRELVGNRGWKRLMRVAQAQVNNRQPYVEAAAGGLDGMIQKEHMTGELAGIKLFMQLPEIQIGSLQEEIKRLTEDMEDEHELERSARGEFRDPDPGIDDFPNW